MSKETELKAVVNLLLSNVQHAKRVVKTTKRYATKLRAEGRIEAYYTAATIVQMKLSGEGK